MTRRGPGLLIVLVWVLSACVPPPAPAARAARTTTTPPPPPAGPAPAVQAMVRIRTLSCDALSVGSGFAVDAHTILTNRHVVAGASRVTADTWDGRELEVTDTRVSTVADLAIITVADTLEATVRLAQADPPVEPGMAVSVLGYPFGHALRRTPGTVQGIRDDDSILFTARVHHGNSGGPLLDDAGDAVGVVYRKVVGDTEAGLALPSSVVTTNPADATFIDNPDCARAEELFGDR